jgi:hypothetical protein
LSALLGGPKADCPNGAAGQSEIINNQSQNIEPTGGGCGFSPKQIGRRLCVTAEDGPLCQVEDMVSPEGAAGVEEAGFAPNKLADDNAC